MVQLKASQIFYSRVSKDQSLGGRPGYQTIGYTQVGIPKRELPEIESRFVYYPREGSPDKRVCFSTSGGRLVVGAIRRLSERDEHGRMIALAHGLVFAPDLSRRFPTTPLAIFETHDFVSDLQQALELRNPGHGDLPETEVFFPEVDPAIAAIQEWSPDELRKLVFYALRAERLAARRTALAVYGSPAAILATLRVAQYVLPASRYAECPVDTYFVDEHGNPCNLLGTYCWATGMPSLPRSGNFISIDAEGRRVLDSPVWKPADAYERWLADKLSTGRFAEVAVSKQAAWEVSCSLAGTDLPASVSEAVFAEVQRAAPAELRVAVRDRLARIAGATLAERLVKGAAKVPRSKVIEYLRGQGAPADLVSELRQAYAAERFARPSPAERSELGKFLQQAPDPRLNLLHAIWEDDAVAQRQAASSISPDDYCKVVRWLWKHGWPQPLALVQPERGQAFVATWLASPAPPDIPLIELVTRLQEVRDTGAIEALVPLLPQQSLDTLKTLRQMCKSSPGISSGFRKAVDAAYRELLANSGIIMRLSNLLPSWATRRK